MKYCCDGNHRTFHFRRRKTDSSRNQGGMALLITVMILSLLVAITIQFHKSTWTKYVISHNHKVGIQLKMIARSGVEIAFALLEQDGKNNTIDSLQDNWATIAGESVGNLFAGESLQLEVTDLTGRLQVNSLVQKGGGGEKNGKSGNLQGDIRSAFLRLLKSGAFAVESEMEAQQILDALVDWLDEDDRESDYGAEQGYYQSLDTPYDCRNGPIQYIEELLLVKGITPELLFGTMKNHGLADYLTVFGKEGKININTAPLLVIKSLDSMIDDNLLERLDEFRKVEDNADNLGDPGWYKNIDGWPGDIVIPEKMLTTKSNFFQITATGQSDTLTKRMITIAERAGDGQVRLLWKKVE